jgi:transcriptional regulator
MKEEKNYFASNLRFLRQKNGLEQIDLATRLGRKSSSSISEWEKGKYTPKAGVLNDIANIFGVSLSKLMSTDLSNPSAQVEEEENSTFKMIQRKAKNLSVTDQERLLQIMELTFQDISNGGVEDDHDF